MATKLRKGALNVRMYNVGFGDCFVLSFPVGDGHKHVLVDFGSHMHGSLGNLEEVAEDLQRHTGGELAVVVATHRHQDHIWGFQKAAGVLQRFARIDEVWLPWVEESTPRTRALWKKHAAALSAVRARLSLAKGARRRLLEAVLANLSPNQEALRGLNTRFGHTGPGRVQYLQGGQADLVSPAGIEGLTVKVLGPPSDEKFLKKLNPPKAERWELAAAGAEGPEGKDACGPLFGDAQSAERAKAYWDGEPAEVFRPAARERFRDLVSDDLDLAFAMEDAVNNSSLVLLFEFGGEALLLPGDAQWGNWKYWIEQQVAPELLERVTLYKAGHHGSHNATPRSVVEQLSEGVSVLVPTQATPFPTIPAPKLMAALDKRSGHRVVRSDGKATLPKGFTRGKFWVDYQPARRR